MYRCTGLKKNTEYDGNNFPGEITHINGADRRVSVMYKARRGKWKWPEKPDSFYYKPETILARIEPPVPLPVSSVDDEGDLLFEINSEYLL